MLKDGFDITSITKYLKYIGSKYNSTKIKKYIQRIAARYFSRKIENIKIVNRKLLQGTITISRNELIKYLTTIKPQKQKSKKIRCYLGILRKKYPIIVTLESAFHYLSNCLKDTNANNLKRFISINKTSPHLRLATFAKSLEKDIIPIESAITTGITSGFVEGGNNKIKLIKRQCYGRMKFPRLARKILTARLFS